MKKIIAGFATTIAGIVGKVSFCTKIPTVMTYAGSKTTISTFAWKAGTPLIIKHLVPMFIVGGVVIVIWGLVSNKEEKKVCTTE